MKLLVVSPHFDDAPLSLGQAMVDGELSIHRVTVGVLFGRTNWTKWFHPTRGRWPLGSAIRFGEEVVNARRFGYRFRVAGFEEAVLRNGSLDTTTFLDPTFDPTTSPVLALVLDRMRRWAEGADVVIAPLGLGDHIDHRLAAHAGGLMAAERSVCFYEDRPYASGLDDEAIASHAAALDPALRPVDVSAPMGPAKHGRLWYPSQFHEFFLDAIAADERAARRERLWVSPGNDWPPA